MASKRRLRRQSCDGKMKYESLERATKAIRKQKTHSTLRAYKCHWCNQYHIGHLPGYVIKEMIEKRGEFPNG